MKIEALYRVMSGFLSSTKQNINSDRIEDALNNTLSRDGTTPNAMSADLDVGLNRVINVGTPIDPTDAVRLQDILGLAEGGTISISGSYNDLTDVPTTFPSSPHTHPNSDLTGLTASLATKANTTHTHSTGDVTGLASAIDTEMNTKLLAGTGVSKSYNSGTGELTISATGTAGSDWNTLVNKPSTFTPSAHTHPESDVTSLVSDLAGKAATGHTHPYTDVTSLGTGVNAGLAAGTGISLGFSGGVTTITNTSGSGGVPHSYYGAWENSIKTSNSAATNSTNINNLITTLSNAGGGAIHFNEPGYYQISSTAILKSYVDVVMVPGAILYWAGPTGGTIVETIPNDTLRGLSCTKINIHSGSGHTGVMCKIHAAITNDIEVIGFGTSTSNEFIEIFPNSNHTPVTIGANNNAFNKYHFHHNETCGNGLICAGLGPGAGYAGGVNVITLNTFRDTTFYQGVQTYGILLRSWFDNNVFTGFTYMNMSGANGLGVGINDLTPTTESGVYSVKFESLAIDTFGSGLNRYGMILNASKVILVDMYHQDPVAENGSFLGTNCLSYQVRMKQDSSNNIYIHQKNVGTGL